MGAWLRVCIQAKFVFLVNVCKIIEGQVNKSVIAPGTIGSAPSMYNGKARSWGTAVQSIIKIFKFLTKIK
jgi:hypothetical protein